MFSLQHRRPGSEQIYSDVAELQEVFSAIPWVSQAKLFFFQPGISIYSTAPRLIFQLQGYSIRWQLCPGNSCGAESRQIAWKNEKKLYQPFQSEFQAKIPRKALYPVQTGIPALTPQAPSSIKSSAPGITPVSSGALSWAVLSTWGCRTGSEENHVRNSGIGYSFQTAVEPQNILAAHIYKSSLAVQSHPATQNYLWFNIKNKLKTFVSLRQLLGP